MQPNGGDKLLQVRVQTQQAWREIIRVAEAAIVGGYMSLPTM